MSCNHLDRIHYLISKQLLCLWVTGNFLPRLHWAFAKHDLPLASWEWCLDMLFSAFISEWLDLRSPRTESFDYKTFGLHFRCHGINICEQIIRCLRKNKCILTLVKIHTTQWSKYPIIQKKRNVSRKRETLWAWTVLTPDACVWSPLFGLSSCDICNLWAPQEDCSPMRYKTKS